MYLHDTTHFEGYLGICLIVGLTVELGYSSCLRVPHPDVEDVVQVSMEICLTVSSTSQSRIYHQLKKMKRQPTDCSRAACLTSVECECFRSCFSVVLIFAISADIRCDRLPLV